MAYRPGPVKIIGWVLKSLAYMLIVFIVSLLIWRIYFSTKIPEKIDGIYVNDKLSEAFEKDGHELYAYYQNQASITRAENNYGYFSVEKYLIIPDAEQVQIVFRYNRSTLEHVKEDYGLADVPSRDDDIFDITLVKTTDMTPEDTSDNTSEDSLAKTRYQPAHIIKETTKLYNYYRVVFDGVVIDKDDVGLFADIYYIGNVDYEEDSYGTLCLYDYEMKNLTYEFDKKEIGKLKK